MNRDLDTLQTAMTKTSITIVVLIAGLLIGIGTYATWKVSTIPLGKALASDKRHKVLQRLIEKNGISGLPEGFAIEPGLEKVRSYEAMDKDGYRIISVSVTYDVGPRGNRHCSFVFDEVGRCLMWSMDRPMLWQGGLLDITRDGFHEKVVTFLEEPAHPERSFRRLRVYRLRSEPPELILDIVFNFAEQDPMFENVYRVDEEFTELGLRHLILRRYMKGKEKEEVRFVWNEDKQGFVASSPETDNWRFNTR